MRKNPKKKSFSYHNKPSKKEANMTQQNITTLQKPKEEIEERNLEQDIDGMGKLTVTEEWERKKVSTSMSWTGPKIEPAQWRDVQAFLRHVNERDHSEAQLRMFCNSRLNRWEFHAFPQEARTGMSAREVDNEEARVQRARFKDSEGWSPMGTIHSHCGASAFQSGTDRNNEIHIDGLHITLGKVDKDEFDLHGRFSILGRMLEITDWSAFWQLPQVVLDLNLPRDMRSKIALMDMCKAPPADQTFPAEWINNVVEVKVSVPTTTYQKDWSFRGQGITDYRSSSTYYKHNEHYGGYQTTGPSSKVPVHDEEVQERGVRHFSNIGQMQLLLDLRKFLKRMDVEEAGFFSWLEQEGEFQDINVLVHFCSKYNCHIKDLTEGLRWEELLDKKAEEQQRKAIDEVDPPTDTLIP